MYSIRRADRTDVGRIAELLQGFHAESTFNNIPLDLQKLKSFLRSCIERNDQICLLSADTKGELGGIIIGHATEFFFSREIGVWDLVVYVKPELRGGTVAFRLWKAYRDWAQSIGAKSLWCGAFATPPEFKQAADRLYTGLGMRQSGALYRLDLANADKSTS